jgi:mannose-1-phosphate guanylyltransferase
LDKSNTSYVDIRVDSKKYRCGYRFAAFASHPDILVITPSDHIIDEMQLYEEAIQEAIEKATNILLLWDCSY